MSGDSTKDYSAIAGVLPPLYLIVIFLPNTIKKNREYVKVIVHFVCVPHIIKNSFTITICTYVYFYTKLLLKITTKTLTNTHTHSSMQTNKVYKIEINASAQT